MRKLLNIYLLFSVLLFNSCSKWLDVQPETEIDKSDLFSTEDGFKEALIGIYTRCAKADLYGKELTMGTPEVLAQNYSIANYDPMRYQATKEFKYNDPYFISRKDGLWKGLYHGIVNSNLIIAHIDEQKNLFVGDNFNIIKGEAFALRAYLHFDVLRLFAPSFAQGSFAEAIPYVTKYSNLSSKFGTVTAVLDSIIKDFEYAKTLLINDPIIKKDYVVGYPQQTDTLQNTENIHTSLFLQNRRHRLNYYAVCASLARVYLYRGDWANALLNAKIVIDSKKFPWTNSTDFLAVEEKNKDRILYKELVFGWYIPNLNNSINTNWFNTGTSGMYLDQTDSKIIYNVAGDGATDMRYMQWFITASNGSSYISEVGKYRRNSLTDEEAANLHYLMAPGVKLSELYYIAAECTYASNPALALSYLNEVRLRRGIGQPLSSSSKDEFLNELLKEYRKDLFAEGQLFFAYKRLNKSIQGLQGMVIQPNSNIFILPIPDDEIIYGKLDI